jgi:hypothetical protein
MNSVAKFGEFIASKLRDRAIDHADGLLAGSWKSPPTQALQTSRAQLSPEQRALVRRVVVASVDSGMHDFLFALGEAHDFKQGIAVIVDGQDVAALSDGLHGEPYTVDGWFARFNKHGQHPESA